MKLGALAVQIRDHRVEALTRTTKRCEVCGARAVYFLEWAFPSYRTYFCDACFEAARRAIHGEKVEPYWNEDLSKLVDYVPASDWQRGRYPPEVA